MAERTEPQKNVKSTILEDIKWSLSCTDACVKAVAVNVKNLQLRMVSVEEEMFISKPVQDACVKAVADTVKRLQIRMDSLEEFVRNKKKEEEDADIPCLLYESNKRIRKLEENEVPDKKNKEKSSLLRE